MAGNPHPVTSITGIATTGNVSKSAFISYTKARSIVVMQNAAEINATDLSGQLQVTLVSTGRVYELNTLDTTTPDDGVACIRDANGLGFFRQAVDGVDGADGASYGGTSTTSHTTAGSGSKAFTTQAGLAYLAGARVRATSTGSGDWMEGVVTSYVGLTLTITMDLNSGSGTRTDWTFNIAGQRGATGSTGSTGGTGATGAGYGGTSTTSLTTGTGSKAFTTQAGLAWQIGARVRATATASGDWMEGLVTNYVTTTLTVNMDLNSGSGTRTDWKINAAGERGTQGATGNTGNTGNTGATGPGYTATSTTSLTAGTGSKVFTTQAGLAYSIGARVRATSTGSSDWMEGLVTNYSGTSLTVNMDLNQGTGTRTDWNINLAGERGTTGSAGSSGASALTICRACATTNVVIASALENADVVDGVTLATGNRVLLTGQTAPAENGVYIVPASGAAARDTSFDTFAELAGCYFSIQEGTANADTLWYVVSDSVGTINVTALTIRQFSGGTGIPVTAATQTAVQAAIAIAEAAGGGIILLPNSDITFPGAADIDISGNNITLQGGPKTRLVAPASGSHWLITATGVRAASTTLSANAAQWATSITVTTATNFVVGDLAYITITPVSNTGIYHFAAVVTSKVGSVIGITPPLPSAINTSDPHTVIPCTPIRNLTLDNIRFYGNGNVDSTRGFFSDALLDCRMTNLSFDGFISAAAGYWNMGHNTYVENITATGSGTALESDIWFRSQTHMSANSVMSRQATGFGPQLHMCFYSNFTGVYAYKAAHRGVKLNSCYWSSFNDLQAHDSGSTGIGITLTTRYCQFTNLIALNNRGDAGSPFNNVGIWFDDSGCTNNTMVNVTAYNNTTLDIYIGPNDTGITIKNARYSTITNDGGATVSTT